MKKPVRPTPEKVQETVDKRVTRTRKVSKRLTQGNLTHLTKQFKDFANANGVSVDEVKFEPTYYMVEITCRRPETPDEKYARIRQELNNKYNTDLARWNYAENQRKREIAEAQRTLALNNVSTNSCCKNCSCKCCR